MLLYILVFWLIDNIIINIYIINFCNFILYLSIFNYINNLIIITVLIISCFVMIYSSVYIQYHNNEFYYFLTILFIISILLLINSNNYLSLFTGWDMLGISRFYLIIFYGSSIVYKNGILTFASNRIGDVLIIISILRFFFPINFI